MKAWELKEKLERAPDYYEVEVIEAGRVQRVTGVEVAPNLSQPSGQVMVVRIYAERL